VSYTNEPDGGSAQIPDLGQLFTTIVGNAGTRGLDGSQQGLALFKDHLTAAEHLYLFNGGVGKSWAQIKSEAGH